MLCKGCSMLLLQVDQLLEYHFEEDMTRLTQHCGKKLKEGRQTIIVSATLKDQVNSRFNNRDSNKFAFQLLMS